MEPLEKTLKTIKRRKASREKLFSKEPCAVHGSPRNSHIDRIDAQVGQCDTWVGAQES